MSSMFDRFFNPVTERLEGSLIYIEYYGNTKPILINDTKQYLPLAFTFI